MEDEIKQYLKRVKEEVQNTSLKDYDISNFENFKIFDFVNFHLIYDYILKSDNNKQDVFISIPEIKCSSHFFESIFRSILLVKLYQNYFSYEQSKPIIDKGDLVYSSKNNRVYKVRSTNIEGNISSLIYRFPKRNEQNLILKPSNQLYTKINPNLSNGRNTANNIENYIDYLSSVFDDKFPFITDFKNRTLVIADKQFFKESKHLPIRYTNRNGKIKNDLPFFNYLVECCNDFNTAQQYLLNNNETFDEIIVIADSKYRENFNEILQEKWQGKYKNIILIGTDKPTTEHIFTDWIWANDEVKVANEEQIQLPNKVTLTDDSLYEVFIALKKEIDTIKEETSVNLSFMLKYTNFFLRMILVNTNLSKGIYQEYLNRLTQYFESEKFEEELNNHFYQQDIYNPNEIKDITDRIFQKFSRISDLLENENLKWKYIKKQGKSNYTKSLFLLVEKKNYDAISTQLKNENINSIRLISDRKIDNTKLCLDKWLDSNSNSSSKTVIVPYLNDFEIYVKLKSIRGTCEVLCYKNIDEINFDKIVNTYNINERNKLTHEDRKKFINIPFEFNLEISKRELDDVFNVDIYSEHTENTSHISDLPQEKCFYEITFDDNSTDKFDSSKGVFLIENGEQIKTTIGEVYEGATIRFYQNESPKEFRKVLEIFDTENLLQSFDKYSESWKSTLQKLKDDYGEIESLYDNLFYENNIIQFNTFKNYFKENKTRFPKNTKTLQIIKDLCEKTEKFKNELVVTEFEKFKVYAKKDHSIRQQAGRLLGSDLLDYVASEKTEMSDSLRKIPNRILERLINTIQEKTITKKQLLDE